MTDTVRPLNDLLALGTEGVKKSFTYQDMRDLIASIAAGDAGGGIGPGVGPDPLHLDQHLSIGPGAPAAAALTLTTQPEVGDTMFAGGPHYTFVAAMDFDTALEISIGTNITTATAAIVAAINGTDGINSANPDVLASSPGVGTVVLTARDAGSPGNNLDSAYFNVGAGTNTFDTSGTLLGGAQIAASGAIRLEAEGFVVSDDGSGTDVQVIGFDEDGYYVCIGGDNGPLSVVNGLESRNPGSPDAWLDVLMLRAVLHTSDGTPVQLRASRDAVNAVVWGPENEARTAFGPVGGRLTNNTDLDLQKVNPATFQTFVKLTTADVLVLMATGLPTSAAGLPAGQVYNDGGTLKVAP